MKRKYFADGGATSGTSGTSGTSDYSNLVTQAYGTLGRAGVGSDPNQIDPEGYNYWLGQLESGAIAPSDFSSVFNTAASGVLQNPIPASEPVADYVTDYVVRNAYENIGRTGIGTDPNQIDQQGYDYWTNQLRTGALDTGNFNEAFTNSVNEVLNNPTVQNRDVVQYINGFKGVQGLPMSRPSTPGVMPNPGGSYTFTPSPYVPVRYTPGYNDYGQGIASLFGRGYSQYFQPPGLTGNYFFGSTGTAPTYVPPAGQGTQLSSITQIPGLTPAQQQQFNTLSPEQQAQYLQTVALYNAPGNVQSDAALISQYMAENNLSVNDMALLVGTTPQVIQSYLGQQGLTDPQLSRYTTLNPTQQSQYAALSSAYNAPGDTSSDAAQMLQIMQQNNLSPADAASITGIPIDAVNAYLAQATGTNTMTTSPERVDYSQYAETPAAGTTPESLGYTTNAQDIADAYLQAAAAGVSGDQFLQYARDVGYTDAQLQAAYDLLQK